MHDDGLTPAERSLRAKLAVETSWANTEDPAARTAPARAAFLDRFDRQVDPNGELPEAERQRRAEHARKAYFSGLSLKAAKARRKQRDAACVGSEPPPCGHQVRSAEESSRGRSQGRLVDSKSDLPNVPVQDLLFDERNKGPS